MPAVSWPDLESVCHGLITGRLKAVSWGAGGSFRLAFHDCPLRPAYLVDNDPAKWGGEVFGIPVHPPDRLAGEDPATTVVIVYSGYFFGAEIQRQLAAIGPFRHMGPFVPTLAFPQLRRLGALWSQDPPSRPAPGGMGIVVQGGVAPEATEWVLRWHRLRHPAAPVILSTWADGDPAVLDRLAPWCDRLVLSGRPAVTGQGNRNLQRVSTLEGLKAARDMGLAKALKTRTDLVVMAPQVLERAARLQALYPPADGGRNRIVVSSRYTQKYIPYNISDLVLFGDVDDLILAFSAPLDERVIDIHAPEYRAKTTVRQYSAQAAIPEVWFATRYLEALNVGTERTLEAYWRALKDHWIVVDEEWFDLFWPKYGIGPVTRQADEASLRRVVDHAFWQSLYFGLDVSADRGAVDLDAVRFDDFFRLALVERGL
ncbi:WavE lipopolysaccharide synthesis family protein [Azospirillum sp.]|uniref:WavE lipopolysaccharide synthesis family protein n=1 Tax=Azospirillum sp. TaxID=34012 RepID=UPI002D4A0A41|nr:WavE lipopolysaccharide synthesis family protein [Azospirillum sp.]HYD68018.1 WavE lipopolysaccharide synthesis family protein [Azospirillum sp.]